MDQTDYRSIATKVFAQRGAEALDHTLVIITPEQVIQRLGADVNAKAHLSGSDYTPLGIATEMGHRDIVTLLQHRGARE